MDDDWTVGQLISRLFEFDKNACVRVGDESGSYSEIIKIEEHDGVVYIVMHDSL